MAKYMGISMPDTEAGFYRREDPAFIDRGSAEICRTLRRELEENLTVAFQRHLSVKRAEADTGSHPRSGSDVRSQPHAPAFEHAPTSMPPVSPLVMAWIGGRGAEAQPFSDAPTAMPPVSPLVSDWVAERGPGARPAGGRRGNSGPCNASGAGSLGGCTTVMIHGIPNQFTLSELMWHLEAAGFEGLYDYAYVPQHAHRRMSCGIAFANFMHSDSAEKFGKMFDGGSLSCHMGKSKRLCVVPAHVQGLGPNLAYHLSRGHAKGAQRDEVFPDFLHHAGHRSATACPTATTWQASRPRTGATSNTKKLSERLTGMHARW